MKKSIGVGDGGRGTGAVAPPKSGKTFSGKYHVNLGILLIFRADFV